MADQTKDALEAIYGRSSGLMGGFQGLGRGQGPIPFRPPGQEPPRLPPALFIDQIEDGHATVVGPDGHAATVPAPPSWHEGMMTNGHPAPPAPQPHYLPWPEDGIIHLGEELPKVPLAPGSPGPPVQPGEGSMIGKQKPQPQKKRRVVP